MTSIDGFDAVRLRSAGRLTEAAFLPDANMLCCSLQHRGAQLLDAGHGVTAYALRGKTMGIPLLHPWANRLAAPDYRAAGKEVALPDPAGRFALDPNGLPIHGALPGLLRWQVQGGTSEDQVRAVLDWDSDELLELFPFVHQLHCEASVHDGRLELTTILRATGNDTVPVSFGYHPYLTPAGRRKDWNVALGAGRRLLLDDQMIPTGASEPIAHRRFTLAELSFDDGLEDLDAPPKFRVSGAGLGLEVTFEEGYSYGQVYAPPGHDFICFEPMTAPANALRSGEGLTVVAPGSEHRAKFTIAVTE